METPLRDLGLDSVVAAQLVGSLKASMGVEVSVMDLLAGSTASDLVVAALEGLAPKHEPAPTQPHPPSTHLSQSEEQISVDSCAEGGDELGPNTPPRHDRAPSGRKVASIDASSRLSRVDATPAAPGESSLTTADFLARIMVHPPYFTLRHVRACGEG
jgi:hypothetical protein